VVWCEVRGSLFLSLLLGELLDVLVDFIGDPIPPLKGLLCFFPEFLTINVGIVLTATGPEDDREDRTHHG
jgi:hypothetical protein